MGTSRQTPEARGHTDPGRNEMAALQGKSGPLGNMNAFKHGLVAIQKPRGRHFYRA